MQTFSRYIWISCLALVHVFYLPWFEFYSRSKTDWKTISLFALVSSNNDPKILWFDLDAFKSKSKSCSDMELKYLNNSRIKTIFLALFRFPSDQESQAKAFQRWDSVRIIPEIGVEIIEIGIKCEMGRWAIEIYYEHNTRSHAGKIISCRP